MAIKGRTEVVYLHKQMTSFIRHRIQSIEFLLTVVFWLGMIGMPFLFTNFDEGFSWEKAFSISRPNISLDELIPISEVLVKKANSLETLKEEVLEQAEVQIKYQDKRLFRK